MITKDKDFKLLAIRPREGCSRKYCNNLKPGQLYALYSNYKFIESDSGHIVAIEQMGTDHRLFNVFSVRENQPLINVSAIVGKNGSGKSSLVDLFYMAGYLVAKRSGLLDSEENYLFRREEQELLEIEDGLKVEIFYLFDGKFGCLVIDSTFERPPNQSNIEFINLLGGDSFRLSAFFYTVVINYSIYGMNERVSGIWIRRLFHKNDGYQTPVVINPFRDWGTINVNNELHFAQTRLLSNMMYTQGDIIPGKRAAGIFFCYKMTKPLIMGRYRLNDARKRLEEITKKTNEQIFGEVYLAFIGEEPKIDSLQNSRWRKIVINYVIRKLFRIALNYPDYKAFLRLNEERNGLPEILDFNGYINALKIDKTHITLKLRQALNFYRYDPLRLTERVIGKDTEVYVPIDEFSHRLSIAIRENPDSDPAEFVPIVPFTPEIRIENATEFSRLSSGEQQYIHSIQAIAYHVLNINSVFRHSGTVQKEMYERVNIILDEIELYFHPEYQRRFLKDLLEYLGNLHIPNITAINILFLTHSPFILSDIPADNVLRMEEGLPKTGHPLTLAGNIHEMLAGSFFMEATTGEMARLHYKEIIAFYESVRDPGNVSIELLKERYVTRREKYRYIVSQIGEDIIRGVLHNHLQYLDERLGIFDVERAQRLENLKQQLNAIQKQIDDASN